MDGKDAADYADGSYTNNFVYTRSTFTPENPGTDTGKNDAETLTRNVTYSVNYGDPVNQTDQATQSIAMFRTATKNADGSYSYSAWTTNHDGKSTSAADQTITFEAISGADLKTPRGYEASVKTTKNGMETTDANNEITLTLGVTMAEDSDDISIVRDVTYSSLPTVANPVVTPNGQGGYDITGTTDPSKLAPGTTVTLTTPDGDPITDPTTGNPITGTTDETGKVVISIPGGVVTPGQEITLTPENGDTSDPTTVPERPSIEGEPTVTPNNQGGYDITGQTDPHVTAPGTTVTLTNPDGDPITDPTTGNPITGTTDETGKVVISIPGGVVTPGQEITLTPENGDTSDPTTVPARPTVTDPTIEPNGNGGYDIKGTTEPGTTVTLTDPHGDPIIDPATGNQ